MKYPHSNLFFAQKEIENLANFFWQGGDLEEVSYHIYLMYDAGLIDAIDASSVGQPMYWVAKRLTWESHEFLEASKNLTVWNQAKTTIAEKGEGMAFTVLKELLLQLLKEAVLG